MLSKNVSEIVGLIASDRIIRSSAVFITILTTFIAVLFNPVIAFLIYICYISGFIASFSIIRYKNKTVATVFQRLTSYCKEKYNRKVKLKHSCSICDDLTCQRHLHVKNVTPWKNLTIDENLNEALEQFLNKIIHNFILIWYGEFTDDKDFINELRYCIKFASASLITRYLEVDPSLIITEKLLPCAIKHIDDYMYMQQIAKLKNVRFNEVIIEYLGKRMHIAATNRRNELGYLQHLVSNILDSILPECYTKCKNFTVLIREILSGWVLLPLMDVLADPNIINSLVILAITYKSKGSTSNQKWKQVEFLQNFSAVSEKKSLFYLDLSKIEKNTELLYIFMQFLKKEEQVHLLQFHLEVNQFNEKLLTPELNKTQLEDLHHEAMKLYTDYLDKNSFNYVGCPEEISEQYYNLIKDGVYGVGKLRTSEPLYQAHDFVFNALQKTWLPLFFHSNEFYNYKCGSKITANYNKASVNRNRKYDSSNPGAVSKISSGFGKIRGVLKANQPIEGTLYPDANVENGSEDSLLSDVDNIFRDLTAWRISIPNYKSTTSNKTIYYCVNVQRLDQVGEGVKLNWEILRRDQDFYTLKSKLVEFHGEGEICDSPLPSRKGSSIENRISRYEAFLKKLLQKPTLRGSDLLFTFLTLEDDFTEFIANSAAGNQDIGNIYQSVAYKLRKEKGQHLDAFMTSFMASTGSKQSRFEWADEITTETPALTIPPMPKTYRNHIFNDNFGVEYNVLKESSGASYSPIGLTGCVFYLLRNVIKVRHGLLKLYVAVCNVACSLFELAVKILIDRKMKVGLSQSNLAYLVKLLEGVIFEPHKSPTKDELEKRKERAFEELRNCIPSFLNTIAGDELNNGVCLILEILQYPHYNKHIVYNLVDIIVTELYPNLGKNSEV